MNIEVNKKNLELLAREYGVKFVVLYGSHVAGKTIEESDVDVAVFFETRRVPESFSRYSEIMQKLAEALQVEIGKLDFVILNKANILLRYEITAKGKLLFGDEDEYLQYKAFAFRDYHDAKSLFQLEDLLIRKRQTLLKQSLSGISA